MFKYLTWFQNYFSSLIFSDIQLQANPFQFNFIFISTFFGVHSWKMSDLILKLFFYLNIPRCSLTIDFKLILMLFFILTFSDVQSWTNFNSNPMLFLSQHLWVFSHEQMSDLILNYFSISTFRGVQLSIDFHLILMLFLS